MFTLSVIPNWTEQQLTCSVCGTNKSVKYVLKSNRNGLIISCCNKCILRYFRGMRKENSDGIRKN